MGSNEQAIETAKPASGRLSAIDYLTGSVFHQPVRNAAFAGLLLFAIFGLSLFVMQRGTSINENLIASTADSNNSEDVLDPAGSPVPTHSEAPHNGVETSSSAPNRSLPEAAKRNPNKSVAAVDREISRKSSGRQLSEPRFRRKAETRGKLPCRGQRSVGLEARLTEAGLLLKWNRVRGAIVHNIYLSDLDERLIDHFETADLTSYIVSAKLDNETVYRLRLIVTFKSGERIVSESQNFKVGDLAKNSQSAGTAEVEKRTAATVRCVEPKQ